MTRQIDLVDCMLHDRRKLPEIGDSVDRPPRQKIKYHDHGHDRPEFDVAHDLINILGPTHDNRTSIRVKLRGDVVSQLGGNCVVQLTNRYPTRNSFFVPYWKPATDGFDVILADPALTGTAIISKRDQNEPYFIDWIVVQM